jgi:hypothetical protein
MKDKLRSEIIEILKNNFITAIKGDGISIDILDPHEESMALLLAETAADRILELIPEREWIPVSERLPNPLDRVLVIMGRAMFFGYWSENYNQWYLGNEHGYYELSEITLWMPLPSLPEN